MPRIQDRKSGRFQFFNVKIYTNKIELIELTLSILLMITLEK